MAGLLPDRRDALLMICKVQQKQCYPSKAAAIRAALSYSKRRGTPLRTYWHKACGSYHLSSKAKVDIHTERAS